MPSITWFLSGEESINSGYVRTGRRFAKTFKRRADAEQAFFGALVRRGVVEFGQAHRAHQGRIGRQGLVERVLGQGSTGLMNGDAADQPFAQFERVPELLGHGMQDLYSRTGHFDADTVAG